MHRAAALLTLCLAFACSPDGSTEADAPTQAAVDAPPAPAAAPLAGAYKAFPLYLRIDAGGTYALQVLDMVDGCLTVRGNGFGSGSWSREGDTLFFEPQLEQADWILEPHDLAVTFEGAMAVPAGDQLSLTLADGSAFSFERSRSFPDIYADRLQ